MSRTQGPRVTVVIPTFNMEKHISETLRSVLSQSFKSFEVLVVDDCSTDDTARIVKELAATDSRIRYIKLDKNSNRPAVPRNVGIGQAQGEYIAFLDHDDLWRQRKLERQVAILDLHPEIHLVHSYLWRFTDFSHIRGFLHLPNPLRRKADYEVLRKQNVIQCSSVVARTSTIRELGGFDERPELRAVEDYHLWLRLAKCHKIAYLSEVQGFYRWSRLGVSWEEDWFTRLSFLDEVESTELLLSQLSLGRRAMRKTVEIPPGIYFHLLEAGVRRLTERLPRIW